MKAIRVFFSQDMVASSAALYSPSAQKPEYVVKSWKRRFPIEICDFEPLSVNEIAIAHDRGHVVDILLCRKANGFGNTDPEIAKSLPYTTGSMLAAAEEAYLSGMVAVSPTSGFHHSGWNFSGGFCTFSGLAIAALHMKKKYGIKVGIVDFDAHFGNGTADVIEKLGVEDDVKHWTFGGDPCKKPEQAVTDVEKVIEQMVADGCELILYQAGADPHVNDPLGGYLTSAELERRDRIVFETCKRLGVGVAYNLAGGYQRVEAATFEESIRPVLDIHDRTMRVCVEVYLGKDAIAERREDGRVASHRPSARVGQES